MTHEQLIEHVGIALAIAGGASEKHARSTLWMEPLSSGTLVRRDIREDRGEQPGPDWVKMPIWEFHYGATARRAIAAVYETVREPCSGMRRVGMMRLPGLDPHDIADAFADMIDASALKPDGAK